MASDGTTPRSRRALLTAAAGAAGALAASAALPLAAAAAPANMQTESDNATTAETGITQATDAVVALRLTSTTNNAPALTASSGDTTDMAPAEFLVFTGAYAFTPTSGDENIFGAGLWGDSGDVGTYGSGYVGVRGDGTIGMVAAGDPGGVGLRAWGGDGSGTDVALEVFGKVVFNRMGKNTIGSGKSSLKIYLAGVTANSRVFAVLHSNRSGRYVRAVVPTTGSFTIYLNSSVSSASYVAWFVLN